MDTKKLIAYFSYSGTTGAMAQTIAGETGGDLFELVPSKPYAKSYNACVAEAKLEKSGEARPALKEDLSAERFAGYDTVFIGYPIWWYDAPMLVYTFLEAHDLRGKTVVPFATSGGSGFCGSEEKIGTLTGASVKRGLLLSGPGSRRQIAEWLRSIGE